MPTGTDEVRVNVVGVFEQQLGSANSEQRLPVLVLRDDINRELRLPIGSCEGLAIHVSLEDQLVARPLTHDLAVRVLEKLSATLERVVINHREEEGPAAQIHLASSRGEMSIEANAGDAVALALRAEAPVYATEELLLRSSQQSEDAL
jgi:bifunctional DNase/RNase